MTMTISKTVVLITFLLTIASAGAETKGEAAHRETVKKDLFAVITLNGSHCEEVVDYEIKNDTLYVVTCKNGNRFRVNVTAEGRVDVDSHDD
jgi:hypothetical protein